MDMQFDINVFAILVLAAVIAVQSWIIVRQSKGLETSFPAAISAFIPTIIQVARDQAAKTETTVDDQAVELLAGVIPMPKSNGKPDDLQAAG